MKPETKAYNIGNGACLMMCDLYLVLKDEKKVGDIVWNNYESLVDKKVINADCYINSHDNLYKELLEQETADYMYVMANQIPLNTLYIAEYDFGDRMHFVVEKNGIIVFSPLEYSNCVQYGKRNINVRYLKKKSL